MVPNKEYIIMLIKKKQWSQQQFAIRTGVSKATISRWLSGKRGAGADLIGGIRRAFPDERFEDLFICN